MEGTAARICRVGEMELSPFGIMRANQWVVFLKFKDKSSSSASSSAAEQPREEV